MHHDGLAEKVYTRDAYAAVYAESSAFFPLEIVRCFQLSCASPNA
jgi:hypothetical protein